MIGKILKKLRLERDMTLEDLAEKIGVSRQTISNWENGHIEPRQNKLKAMAVALGVSLDSLTQTCTEDCPDTDTNVRSESDPMAASNDRLTQVARTANACAEMNRRLAETNAQLADTNAKLVAHIIELSNALLYK